VLRLEGATRGRGGGVSGATDGGLLALSFSAQSSAWLDPLSRLSRILLTNPAKGGRAAVLRAELSVRRRTTGGDSNRVGGSHEWLPTRVAAEAERSDPGSTLQAQSDIPLGGTIPRFECITPKTMGPVNVTVRDHALWGSGSSDASGAARGLRGSNRSPIALSGPVSIHGSTPGRAGVRIGLVRTPPFAEPLEAADRGRGVPYSSAAGAIEQRFRGISVKDCADPAPLPLAQFARNDKCGPRCAAARGQARV